MSTVSGKSPRIAVVGGGLAGLAAGSALADYGFHVTLFERRPYLGGRASSYEHPGTSEVVDNCQHVLLGCCTNLVQFYDRLGVQGKIRWYDRLTFLEPGGRVSTIASSVLPAPFHNSFSFLRASCLGLRDKIAIASAMSALTPGPPRDNGESFLTWLRHHHQTERAIERFWKTILVSALNEDLDRMSVPYAAQVIRESFLKSATAGRMGVPTVPLTDLYSAAGDYIHAHGGEIRFRAGVDCFRPETDFAVLYTGGAELSFDFVILAVPFDVLSRMLPQVAAADPLRAQLGHFETSPITGIHLWFDRQITDLDHAVLLDRTVQWMFHKSKLLAGTSPAKNPATGFSSNNANGSYVELVVSSSKNLVEKSKSEITQLALNELGEFFPRAGDAKLLKSTVIKEVNATFSPCPGVDTYRPGPVTIWPRVLLAGDWIATGWPATMEGAVRSGYLAAEAVTKAVGKEAKFLVPDLPASGFMQLFG